MQEIERSYFLGKIVILLVVLLGISSVSYGQNRTTEDAIGWIESNLSIFGYGNSVNECKLEIDSECQVTFDFYNTEINGGSLTSFFAQNINRVVVTDKRQEEQRDLTTVIMLLEEDTAHKMIYRGSNKEKIGSSYIKKVRFNFEQNSKEKNIPSRVKEAVVFTVDKCGGEVKEEKF